MFYKAKCVYWNNRRSSAPLCVRTVGRGPKRERSAAAAARLCLPEAKGERWRGGGLRIAVSRVGRTLLMQLPTGKDDTLTKAGSSC